jgi:hypothetical protein
MTLALFTPVTLAPEFPALVGVITVTGMNLRRFCGVALALLAATACSLSAGCYVEDEAPPPAYAGDYEPMYYDGAVVYYDDVGRPYYYMNGAVVWVAPSSPLYVGFVNHWHMYGPGYRRWYASHGYRYRGYYRYHRR